MLMRGAGQAVGGLGVGGWRIGATGPSHHRVTRGSAGVNGSHSAMGSQSGSHDGGAGASVAKFWFDPLYVEDPLRPGNNVGRNCFRIYAIQQEFAKAHQLCMAQHAASRGAAAHEEYSVLALLLREVGPEHGLELAAEVDRLAAPP